MKILPLSYLTPVKNIAQNQVKQNSMQTTPMQETTGIPGMYAYRDYNINFGARLFRTPQNFYEQDFNEQNMPRSLHEYIYETGDPAFKRSIPPAQAMKEVFGKIKEAKDLDEVREMFPNEPLFQNLSSKPKRKSREGLLGMINLLKEDPTYADKTLFKNGQNDLGMYIIKKIYIEGKTLKEINKDFNKDVSVYFKSYDITPQDYSAFGIRFPERPFWKSFIATREDFPYVYIPRVGVNGGSGNGTKTSGSHDTRTTDVDHTPKPRKYKLKDYQKKQLTDDIIDAKGDAQAIEKKVIKRFKKDDPEASFIVKYLSPIMTVAADKVHLSEEMRYFTEEEKENGKTVKGATMFERFWKANPFLLKEYSQAITDTIDMFEDVYGAGGMVPMNKEFEEITKKSANQKAIDYVTPEFLELLDYTKTIEPKRNARYAKHDEEQAMWEAHFKERYGDAEAQLDEVLKAVEELKAIVEQDLTELEALEKEAAKYGAEVITLRGKNGEDVHITGNIDEVYEDVVKNEAKLYPTTFANNFIKFMKTYDEISDRYKLSVATRQVSNMLDDDKIMTDEEFEDESKSIYYTYYMHNPHMALAAGAAMADTLMKYSTFELPLMMYRLYADEFNTIALKNSEINSEFRKIMSEHRRELDNLYTNYTKDITPTELNKIRITMLEQLSKYHPAEQLLPEDSQEIILMLKEMTNNVKFRRKILGDALTVMIPNYRFSRGLLDKNLTPDQKMAKFEHLMGMFVNDFMNYSQDIPVLLTILNRETIEKHKNNLSAETYEKIMAMVDKFPHPEYRRLFEYSTKELKDMDEIYKRK